MACNQSILSNHAASLTTPSYSAGMYVRDSPVIRYRTRGFLQCNMAHRELRDTMGQGQPSDVTSPEECSAIGTPSPLGLMIRPPGHLQLRLWPSRIQNQQVDPFYLPGSVLVSLRRESQSWLRTRKLPRRFTR